MSTLVEVSRFTEEEAREYLEAVLWPNGPVCPHCGTVDNAAKLAGTATRPGVYKCRERECRKQFTVTVNDVNEMPTAVTLTPSSIAENVGASTAVGTLATTDQDVGKHLCVAVTGHNAAGSKTLDCTGITNEVLAPNPKQVDPVSLDTLRSTRSA